MHCDNLVHVNNKKKCYKMKKYVKDRNFVCRNCEDENTTSEESSDDASEKEEEPEHNRTFTVNNSANFFNMTIDGLPAGNMIFEDLHNRAQEDSFECSVCGAKAPSDEGLQLHKEIEHRLRFKCITCNKE